MKIRMMAATAALMTTAAVSQAQERVTRTDTVVTDKAVAPGVRERTTEKSTKVSADGVVKKDTTTVDSTTYETRLGLAYKSAGLTQDEMDRLRVYDMKIREARRANDEAKIKEYYSQQTRLLKPEQVARVRTYFVQNPVAATVPAYERTVWEEVPGRAGLQVDTPVGSIGIGGSPSTVVPRREVVPAQEVIVTNP